MKTTQIFTREGDQRCKAESYLEIDPKGNIPKWLVNYYVSTHFDDILKFKANLEEG